MRGTKLERSPGVWRLRVYVGRRPSGTPIQASRTFRGGAREADRALRAFIAEVEQTSREAGRTATFASLLDTWVEHLATGRARPYTIAGYRATINATLKPAFGQVRLDQLTAHRLDNVYAGWLAAGTSPATVHKRHTMIAAALQQAYRWGWVAENVARRASPPPASRPKPAAPSPEDVQALVRAAEGDSVLVTAIALAALTGARRGELCALRWSDVKLEVGELTVARSLTVTTGGQLHEGPTKTDVARVVALDPVAVAVLRLRLEQQHKLAALAGVELDPNAYVLSRTARGAEPCLPHGLTAAFTRLVVSAGMVDRAGRARWHFHSLRHFAATHAIASGADARTVASRLGHADPAVTLRVYAAALAGPDRTLAAALGAVLTPRELGSV